MKTKLILGAVLLVVGCPSDGGGGVADTDSSTGPGATDTNASSGKGPTSGQEPTTTGTSGGPDGSTTAQETGEDGWPEPQPPLPCPEEYRCREDQDLDAAPLECDNAPDHTNPDQGDMDFDSIGDVADLCPTVQGINNTADSDRDGVGNACDRCPLSAGSYLATGLGGLSDAFAFRSMPDQGDADGDGIGDACDNCVQTPNCLGYGEGLEHELGVQLDIEDPQCQADADGDFIGDACEGLTLPGAAGPVGMGPGDDFDQDGIANAQDACVRLPVAQPGGRHVDSDSDGVGDRCDNCPFTSNSGQADTDGDAVGDACEAGACAERANPRPFGFFDASVGGWCCTSSYEGQELLDPDGNPLQPGDLPPLGAGVLELPAGCDGEAQRVTLDDVGSDEALWDYLCRLPQWDQDFDGVPDACDMCRWAFDPTNAPYVDANGMTWPTDGAFCNGEYRCEDE
ncbi:MAG: thrombospondin type 3 repeat-containing protein [Nannocystales bacterium]